MKKRTGAGFTLVEIMITVVIIAMLAVLAVPGFMKIRASSQEKAIVNNLRQIADAAQQYFLEYGAATVTSDSLVGSGRYVSSINLVAGEIYPSMISQTDITFTATGSKVSAKPNIVFTR